MNLEDKINCKVPFGTIDITRSGFDKIVECLVTKRVTNGEKVNEFERQFAKVFRTKYAVAVSSGTDANTLALSALYDLGACRGDEVIIPALSFIATGNSVFNAGFKPVFVDIRRDTLTLDVSKLEAAITNKTRAIMPVHLMGKPCDMDPIMEIANRRGLFVIEDCAEAHGAEYNGKLVGTFGEMACFSLYAAHIITSIEGGMVITNSPAFESILKSLRNHGVIMNGSDWTFRRIGFSSKMNELEASIGLGSLEMFNKTFFRRKNNFRILSEGLKYLDHYFIFLKEEEHENIGPHAFSIIVKENAPFTKEDLVTWLTKAGVDNRNLFYSMPTQCKAYEFLGYKLGDFPEAEFCSNNGTHIGVHQGLVTKHLDYIAHTIYEFLEVKTCNYQKKN